MALAPCALRACACACIGGPPLSRFQRATTPATLDNPGWNTPRSVPCPYHARYTSFPMEAYAAPIGAAVCTGVRASAACQGGLVDLVSRLRALGHEHLRVRSRLQRDHVVAGRLERDRLAPTPTSLREKAEHKKRLVTNKRREWASRTRSLSWMCDSRLPGWRPGQSGPGREPARGTGWRRGCTCGAGRRSRASCSCCPAR